VPKILRVVGGKTSSNNKSSFFKILPPEHARIEECLISKVKIISSGLFFSKTPPPKPV
jgi:hypothetical protein